METLRKHLEKLRKIERKKHHPLIHKIHKKHKISKKTLFYVKEYGPHTHVPRTIIKESIKILLMASIISSFGGFALEYIKTIFVSILPLIILLPTLNDMIGDYGTIISSRFSTMLHENKINKKWWLNKELKKLLIQIMIVSLLTAILSVLGSVLIASFYENITSLILLKTLAITVIDVMLLVSILFITAIIAGLYVYRKEEDPNNFLIPITTSVADFGNMIILAVLIILFF